FARGGRPPCVCLPDRERWSQPAAVFRAKDHQESVMSYQHQYVDGTRIHFPLGKVVCVGRNYAEHAKELNNPVPSEPLLFIKPASAVVDLEGGFAIPEGRGEVHYET